LLPNRVDHGVHCHRPSLAPTTCRLELVAAVVKTVVAMSLETEAVARQQQNQGSSGGGRNVGVGRWHSTAAIIKAMTAQMTVASEDGNK
jgi:hypothetical protein